MVDLVGFLLRRPTVAALTVALVGLVTAEGFPQETLVAQSQDGRTAWAVVREWRAGGRSGKSSGGWEALTEVYVADRGGDPRRIRSFPGRPEGLCWEGDRLIYADQGLKLTLVAGGPGRSGVEAVLAPVRRWAVSMDGGEDVPALGTFERLNVETFEREGGAGSQALPEALKAGVGPEAQRALEMTRDEFNLAMMAYQAAQGGDFEGASVLYRRAADQFEKMPSAVKTLNLSKAVCQAYAGVLRVRGKARGPEMGRAVCADHLAMIGEFLRDFAASHEGRYPKDLVTLRRWVEQRAGVPEGERGGVISQLFRSPVDVDTARMVSYGYRPLRSGDGEGTPVVWSYFYVGRGVELVKSGEGFRVIDRPLGPAQADSLLKVGLRSMEVDSPAVAVEALEAVTRIAPDLVQGHVKLGYACLRAGRVDRAEKAFWKAMSLDGKLAEAHHGMGMVFTKKPKGLYTAIHYFVEALKLDPRYVEARYHLAEARMKLEEYDALKEAERAVAIDSTYAPTYALIGKWYEVMKEDYEKAALWYTRYLRLRSDDSEVRLRLGRVYLESRNFEKITQTLMDYVQQHPEEVQTLPVLGQACMEMKRLDQAQTFFQRYLAALPDSERVLYEDIQLVAYPERSATGSRSISRTSGASATMTMRPRS